MNTVPQNDQKFVHEIVQTFIKQFQVIYFEVSLIFTSRWRATSGHINKISNDHYLCSADLIAKSHRKKSIKT